MGDPKKKYHVPVLLNEVIELLQVRQGLWYVDATAGGGGHTEKILELGGKVLAIDVDPDSIVELNLLFKDEIEKGNLIVRNRNFSHLIQILKETEIEKIAGILFDLGMSTHQIDDSGRGFSYLRNEPLDMRMSAFGQSAKDIINTYSEEDLYEIFRKYGEEQLAGPIVRALILARTIEPIQTTAQLAALVGEVGSMREKDKTSHISRIFQALRIEINQEIRNLKEVLPQTVKILEIGGKGVVVSFHSLEDRVVKLFLRSEERQNTISVLTRQPIIPAREEILLNRRARSAKMRAFVKI